MSPRSREFIAAARERLENARDDLRHGHLAGAASAAYYSTLYAARAALSERDRYAKTHSGAWALFSEEFVAGGEFDRDLARQARAAQSIRELGDYEASTPAPEAVSDLISVAERFLAAVEALIGK